MSRPRTARNLFIADECEEDEEMDVNDENSDNGQDEELSESENDILAEGNETDPAAGDSSDNEFQARPVPAQRMPPRFRPSLSVPHNEQQEIQLQYKDRGSAYTDMFALVQHVVGHGAKIADLLAKTDQTEQCQLLDQAMMRLAEFDKELDIDRRAVDETKTRHGKDESDKPVLEKHFTKIRKELQVPNPGRHQAEIQQVRTRIAQIQESAARQAAETRAVATSRSGGGANANADESIEMEMISAHVSDKDPYTKRPIQEPMRNPICSHVYDKESIKQYIDFQRGRRQLYQCPVEMCKNKKLLDLKQLVPYPEFFQLVRRRTRSRSRSRSRPAPYPYQATRRRSRSRTTNAASTSQAIH